jgi:hypothetical protein
MKVLATSKSEFSTRVNYREKIYKNKNQKEVQNIDTKLLYDHLLFQNFCFRKEVKVVERRL